MSPGRESYRPFRLEVRGVLRLGTFHVGTGRRLSLASDAPILLDTRGRPYLPGSSLRGVLRSHLEREAGLVGGSIDTLFGKAPQRTDEEGTSQFGRLIVQDAVPAEDIQFTEVRDHVKVSLTTGAAADGAKFDMEVAGGERLLLTLVYEGESEADEELALVHEAVRALESGDLTCGAKAGWGYGRLRLEAKEVFRFDRATPHGLAQWLDFRLTGKRPEPFELKPPAASPGVSTLAPLSWLELEWELSFDGPALVRAPIPPVPDATDRDAANPETFAAIGQSVADHVFVTTGVGGRPYLPGSSLRGVLRHQAERITRTVQARGTPVDWLFGRIKDTTEGGRKSRIEIGDGELVGEPRRVYLDHVALDRITGFAADKRKFSTCALESPRFRGVLRVRFTEDELPLVALTGFLLRDLADGWLWCGGGVTRGYGHISGLRIVRATGDFVLALAPPAEVMGSAKREERPGRVRFCAPEVALPDLNWLWEKAETAWAAQLPAPEERSR